MTDLRGVLSRLVTERDLFALGGGGGVRESDNVHGHLLAPMILLATRDDVLAKVFPADGAVHPEGLYDRLVDPHLVSEAQVRKLAKYRAAFAMLQIAWLELSSYQDPPCLDNGRMDLLINFSKTLVPRRP